MPHSHGLSICGWLLQPPLGAIQDPAPADSRLVSSCCSNVDWSLGMRSLSKWLKERESKLQGIESRPLASHLAGESPRDGGYGMALRSVFATDTSHEGSIAAPELHRNIVGLNGAGKWGSWCLVVVVRGALLRGMLWRKAGPGPGHTALNGLPGLANVILAGTANSPLEPRDMQSKSQRAINKRKSKSSRAMPSRVRYDIKARPTWPSGPDLLTEGTDGAWFGD